MKTVNILGAGIAGCEAAYQLAKRGYNVNLFEMKGTKRTPAHHIDTFAELVCSNSFKNLGIETGAGLLKDELLKLDSFILKTALSCRVPAGNSLSVDRERFSQAVTKWIHDCQNINLITEVVFEIPEGITIIATGPLTDEVLADNIAKILGDNGLYFYDAAAPIITKESIDMNFGWMQSRFDKGGADYINLPMSETQFNDWYDMVISAKTSPIKDFEMKVYEGCLPFEEIAKRGKRALLFGPMQPKGLGGHLPQKPYAVVQLRQDNFDGTLYNIVGFQTNIKWGDQKSIIRAIPGLQNAEIVRYGVMHRNTFINTPKYLNADLSLKTNSDIYFAGQIMGWEGYNCAVASGLYAALQIFRKCEGNDFLTFPKTSMLGALVDYTFNSFSKTFQPIGPSFGLMGELKMKANKMERKQFKANRAVQSFDHYLTPELKIDLKI